MTRKSSDRKEGKLFTCLDARYQSCPAWDLQILENKSKRKEKKNPAPGAFSPSLNTGAPSFKSSNNSVRPAPGNTGKNTCETHTRKKKIHKGESDVPQSVCWSRKSIRWVFFCHTRARSLSLSEVCRQAPGLEMSGRA